MSFMRQDVTPDGAGTSEFEEILYHITHDLRASLRALRVVPGWVRDDMTESGQHLPDSAAESLGMMEAQAERMDRMLLDLRTISRIGRKSDRPEPVSLLRELRGATARLYVPPGGVVRENLEVDTIVAPPNEVRLLLDALLDNAIKHHNTGEPVIVVASRTLPGRIEISVTDNGPGIPDEFRDRVFEMLTTLRPRDEVEGSGLGLAIARKICRCLGGDITACDGPGGQGASLVIDLPETCASA